MLGSELELARGEARAWEARAWEAERARAQVVRRLQVARTDLYDASLREEEAEARAKQAEIRAEQAIRERDALLSSSIWRATWPLRAVGQRLPAGVRRGLRAGATTGWWCISLGFSRKLHRLAVGQPTHYEPNRRGPTPGWTEAQSRSAER
jgi:hypothetical protein